MSFLIPLALLIDLLVGDPRCIPHPVMIIGRLIKRLEETVRRVASTDWGLKLGGCLLVISVCSITFVFSWGLILLATKVHLYLGIVLHIWLLSTTLAVKGLAQHAMAVAEPLSVGDLATARDNLALIVGRDTKDLDYQEIARGTVETVAENTVDGIVAPLVFAAIGGAPLAMTYKAINTMDSMIGHRSKQYVHLGWAAARLDDLANYLPARMTGIFYALIAPFTPGGFKATILTMFYDAQKHPSPNSGIPEAAVAGALGVQLGGTNYYQGMLSQRALMGKQINKLSSGHIQQALKLTYWITTLAVIMAVYVSYLLGGMRLW